ncbi:replicative DNA helicase [Hydrogenophaga sp. T2]|uniref:replicative DNA helicase n=1 Tax=Hydrogenophaga sp. T2 TaxID=3132823 RepID=UPI003CF97946
MDDFEAFPESAQLRVPPHSIESEQAVLGALLLDNEAWDRVCDLLTVDDFYRHENRLVFAALASMINANRSADVVTVFEHLQRQGKDEEAGGLLYLNQLAQYLPSAASIRRYGEIVRERAVLRRLVATSDEIATDAFNPGDRTVAELVNDAQQKLFDIAVSRGSQQVVAIGEALTGFMDRISDLADGSVAPGVKTKIPSLDWRLGGGLKPGKLIVIAARPSVGKTALALQIARAFAEENHGVGVFSMEMERQELVERFVAQVGEIDLGHLVTGKLTNDEWPALTEAVPTVTALPIYVDDQPSLSASELQAKARKLKRSHGIGLVVVDYLQLMSASAQKAKDSRHHQIEEISRGLKTLAKQLGVPLILLSQLSREVEKRTNKRATLADLKESGAIEEDADIVVLLSDDAEELSTGAKVIHAEIAKNRGGQKGWFKLAFEGRYQRFKELARNTDSPIKPAAPTRRYAEDFDS